MSRNVRPGTWRGSRSVLPRGDRGALRSLCSASPRLSSGVSATSFTGRAVAITDDDTVTVLRHRTQIKVRHYRIDCPEKGQPFGRKARQCTSDLAFGKTVAVIEKDMDRYGRTVAEVILPDGRSLHRELVRTGYAW